MIQPDSCPYKGIKNACQKCPNYNTDMDTCHRLTAQAAVNQTQINCNSAISAPTYEERWKDYQEQREELLKLSKEQLVDLIIHAPTFF